MSGNPTRSGAGVLTSDRQGFDRRWYSPNVQDVYVPTTIDDVAPCLESAIAAYGRNVKIVSGRHCYENFAYNDEAQAVIDMSALNRVEVDPIRGYSVEAGCENWTVYRTLLNGYGKTLPAGSCYSVGAGGHITGGGYGLLSRLRGLTIDWLTGVEIVTWDAGSRQAQLRYVSDNSADPDERDLFWALKGAGCGNFGVITRYYFAELPDAPDHAALLVLAWNWSDVSEDDFVDLLALYGELVAEMPESDFSLLKLNHKAAGQLGLVYQSVSAPGMSKAEHRSHAAAHAERLKARFANVAPLSRLERPLGGHPGMMTALPASMDVQHLTYLEALQTLNGSGPNQFGKYKSAYMRKAFPEAQARTIYRQLQIVPDGVKEADMAQSLLQVDSYGGAINTVDPAATAVPQRSSIMKLQYQTYWDNASPPGGPGSPADKTQTDAHLKWINDFYAAVYIDTGGVPDPEQDPSGTVDGCYFNYPDSVLGTHAEGDVDRALRLYFLDNYRSNPRNLVAVKARWDPADMFHHAQSIPVR